MPDNEVKFPGGGTGSKQPRLELIPYIALIRGAARFELGIANRPDGTAWNALSTNFRTAAEDQEFMLSRAAHTAQHAMKLKAILAGEISDDGDDHAGAVFWGACFLICATEFLAEKRQIRKCSACGGTGKSGEWIGTNWMLSETPCPACHGSGLEGARKP
jgi:hypothetical protein